MCNGPGRAGVRPAVVADEIERQNAIGPPKNPVPRRTPGKGQTRKRAAGAKSSVDG